MDSTIGHRQRVEARPFLVGVFFPTMSGGWIMSKAAWDKRKEQWRWPYLQDLARRADALDLDYLFIAMGYPMPGGFGTETHWREHRMESIATTAAVMAVTRRIMVCPTVHLLYHIHPIFLAQLATTIDQIGGGRLGFNLVAGMSTAELRLLDVPPLEHEERYLAANEFATLLIRAWTEDQPFDFAGRYFRSERAWVSPKPVQKPYPLLVNAGLSPAGRDFAARVCDWSFINPPNVSDLAASRPLCDDLKSRAAAHGKSLRLLTQALIFCRATDREAQEYFQWVVDNADESAVEAWQAAARRAFDAGLTQDTSRFASDRARGEGRIIVSGLPIIGSPQTIVDRLIELRQVGLDGVHLGFLDYDELDLFGAQVLPLLQEAGLR